MQHSQEIDTLIKALGNHDLRASQAARGELAELGEAAVGPLVALAQTGTTKQIIDAISVLGQLKDDRASDMLLVLLNHPKPVVRMSAAKALGQFNTPIVLKTLIAKLCDEEEIVQIWVIESLGLLGDHQAIEPLLSILANTASSTVRYTIIKVLGILGDPQVVDHIRPFLHDESRHVQRYTKDALVQLGYKLADNEAG